MSIEARSTEEDAEPTQLPSVPAPIDMRKLAEKVYRLLLEDLRLEQGRGARTSRGKGPR